METLAFVVVLFAIIGVYAIRRVKKRALDMSGLLSGGETVTGKVVMAERVRRSRTHYACRVRYAFVARDGNEYEREIEVLPNELERYREGQAIDVIYNPGNPNVSMLASAVADARDARNTRHAPR